MKGVTHVEALAIDAEAAVWAAGTFDTAGGAASCSISRCRRVAEKTV